MLSLGPSLYKLDPQIDSWVWCRIDQQFYPAFADFVLGQRHKWHPLRATTRTWVFAPPPAIRTRMLPTYVRVKEKASDGEMATLSCREQRNWKRFLCQTHQGK